MRNALAIVVIALSACSEKGATPDNRKPAVPSAAVQPPESNQPPAPGRDAPPIPTSADVSSIDRAQYRAIGSNSGSQEVSLTLNVKSGEVSFRSEMISDSHAGRSDVLKTAEGVLDAQELARFVSAMTPALLSQLDKDCPQAPPGPDGVYMELVRGDATKQYWCKNEDGKELADVLAFGKAVDAFEAELQTAEKTKRFKLEVRDRSNSKPQL